MMRDGKTLLFFFVVVVVASILAQYLFVKLKSSNWINQ